MRKDDRLRRSELFLPPPSINSRRPIPSDEELEEKQVSAMMGVVFVAAVLSFIFSSFVYGTGLWLAIDVLEPSQLEQWNTTWWNCVLAAGCFCFCRTWYRASSKN